MKEDYNRNVSLLCITCGSTDAFDFNEDKTYVKCTSCNREYLGGYDELVELNQENIDNAVDKMGEEILEDLEDEILRALKGK